MDFRVFAQAAGCIFAMWKCHKCGKPVYFAERKQSLGYDWHPECLRCEECGKRLNPGQHAEHKGVPYCHVPCYGALFGPQLFGHGTRVESHKNFGQKGIQGIQRANSNGTPALPRDHLESKLKLYNQFYDNKSLEVRSREVNNRLILEGALRVYWGVQGVIHLKEDDDQRTVAIRKRNSGRYSTSSTVVVDDNSDKENDGTESVDPATTTTTTGNQVDDLSTDVSLSESMTFDSCSLNEYPLSEEATTPTTPTATQSTLTTTTGSTASTLPSKLESINNLEWDEIDDLLQVERRFSEKDKIYETMPVKLPSSQSNSSESSPTKSASEQSSSSTTTETSSDNFITASASLGTTTTETTTTNPTTDIDDETLKPMDFEDFKRSIHQEYVNGSNDFPEINEDTLKKNQPIDPSRINDSLKLYGENAMSKSFNCEQALRSIDPSMINDTLCRRAVSGIEHSSARSYALQKSGSANSNHNNQNGRSVFEKGINRSKSGPTCFEFTDSEDESSTLKPRKPSTIRRNEPRYVNIRMDCYPPNQSDNDTSKGDTNSSDVAGELTATETYINGQAYHVTEDGVVLRRPPRTGSTAIKRRSGNKRSRTKLKRRCSINGHFYNRETSFFTPPYGSQMSVWVTSLVTTQEVINLILEKYKVDSPAENFSLFILRDNGEQKRLKDTDYPLVVRIMLGPHEDVARMFLMDAQRTQEISNEVAQFINLSVPECRAILDRYNDELEREIAKVREKYAELRRRIVSRMESLKVRL